MPTTINDKLGYLATTTEMLSEIHNGKAFSISLDGSIGVASSILMLGRVGDKEIHFHNINGTFGKGNIRITLFEDPTITAEGTPITATNMNRAFTDTHTMSVFTAPTVTDNGLDIGSVFFPITGGGAHTAGATGGIAGGRVLKRNTDYIMKIENTDNAEVSFGTSLIWVESNVLTAE